MNDVMNAPLALLGVLLAGTAPAVAAEERDDVVLDAIVDELGRSMTLKLEDLQSPYFVQYTVEDATTWRIAATCGAIVASDDDHARRLSADVRVGYYDLDNTNFAGDGGGGAGGFGGRGRGGGGFGGMTALPVEDGYAAIRHATWLATDSAYKSAVEALARKKAYLEGRTSTEERADDFARVDPVVSLGPKAEMPFDAPEWEARLRRLSARFLRAAHVLDAQVTLTGTAENRYVVNSEGTRIRLGDTGVVLSISAQAQAADGEQLDDRITHHAATPEALPDEAALVAEIDAMTERLAGRASAPALETYLGPVLFDGAAAPQLFQAMLGRGVAGTPDPVGGGRRRFAGMESLEQYLGKRILPRGFNVFDDPRVESYEGAHLAGHYAIDDEGVAAQRVDLVVDGKFQGMLTSRAPTAEFTSSNGHGRAVSVGPARAAIGCLFVESSEGLSDGDLRVALLDAVRDQGLEFGVRVEAIGVGAAFGGGGGGFARRGGGRVAGGGEGAGGGSALADPVAVYKVFLDGHEELVRGCEFGSIDVGALKDIVAAGRRASVHNAGAAAGAASVVAPAVLFDEVEIFAIEDERPKLPIVPAPHQRGAGG